MLELNKNDNTFVRYTLGRFGYGDLVSQRRSNATSFYHFDAIGTTRALTDASQAVTDTYIQRAFGATRTTTGSTANYYRYIGKLGYYREGTLPAYYLRRRYYSPELGRFLSRDPARGHGRSRYRYVRGRPTRLVDPSGRQASAAHCAVVGGELDRLRKGPFPANCQALNDLMFQYLHDCRSMFPEPLPKSEKCPWPHMGLPRWIPSIRDVPGYVEWALSCHSLYMPPPSPPGQIVWPPEKPVLPPPTNWQPPPFQPPQPPPGMKYWVPPPFGPGVPPVPYNPNSPILKAVEGWADYQSCYDACLVTNAVSGRWDYSIGDPVSYAVCLAYIGLCCEIRCEPLNGGADPLDVPGCSE